MRGVSRRYSPVQHLVPHHKVEGDPFPLALATSSTTFHPGARSRVPLALEGLDFHSMHSWRPVSTETVSARRLPDKTIPEDFRILESEMVRFFFVV